MKDQTKQTKSDKKLNTIGWAFDAAKSLMVMGVGLGVAYLLNTYIPIPTPYAQAVYGFMGFAALAFASRYIMKNSYEIPKL